MTEDLFDCSPRAIARPRGEDRVMIVAPPPTSTNSLATVCGRGTSGLQAGAFEEENVSQDRLVEGRGR